MGTPFYLPTTTVTPEILAPEHEPVRDYDQALQDAAKALRVSSMRIAYYSFRMRMSDGWVAFGFPSGPRGEEQYREHLGIPRSSWYKFARIGQAFHQLPLEELERIPVSNAVVLLSVDPAIKHDFPWVREAKSLPSDDLAKLVIERNRSVGSKQEPMTNIVFRVPALAKQAIEGMLDRYQHQHELSGRGQALELLVADRHDRPGLLAAIEKAQRLMGAVAVRLKEHKGLGEEADWIRMAMEVLHEASEEAVQAARAQSTGVQGDGGRA